MVEYTMMMNNSRPFEELVDTHSAEIFAYLWRMLQNTADAEDCLQDTFLRAFKAFPRLKPDSNARAWLYKIATNTARTFAVRRRRTAMRQQPLAPQQPALAPSVGEQVAQRELLARVRAAVDTLPHKQRAALLMRKYQALSYAEIAAALGGNEAAARANVSQAVRKLRKLKIED